MRPTTIGGNLLVVLVISLCLAQGSSAQQATGAKPAANAKAASKVKPTEAPPSKAAAPAPSMAVASSTTPKVAVPAKPKPKAKAKSEPPAPAANQPVIARTEPVNKRDPFAALVSNRKDAGSAIHLPPGKAGLVIATVRVDGAVRSGTGMIAIVSNPGNSVYFIREGDRLYDGSVEKIGLDGVTFREDSKDAFGHPIQRTVTKRIYAIAGEQQ
jgi:Tfp pilus assembly protein PilP